VRGDDGLTSFESSLDEMMRRMGLPDPALMAQLSNEWDSIAGDPWKGRSRPLTVSNKTLVVEASAPSMVAFLRYGQQALLDAIAGRFGEGLIEAIDIRAPGR
jgi:predicted nucleic acid-binding Zn ribbon protein